MTQKFWVILYLVFYPPPTGSSATHIRGGAVGKPYVQDSRRQQQSPLSSGASQFAAGYAAVRL